MSFVANPATLPSSAIDDVAGDGWYPALKVSAFKVAMRMGPSVSDARAREALIGGLVSAAVGLSRWRTSQEAQGVTALEHSLVDGLPGPSIAGEKRAVILWRRAVHAFAAADLVETHSDISATESGRDRREVRAASADDLRRDATVALRDLMGRTRAKVALV